MKRSRTRTQAALLAPACALLGACADARVYAGDGVVQLALSEDTAPAFESEDGALYLVERRIDLPIRSPTEATFADLADGAASYEGLPFARLPWVTRGEIEVQVDFVLSSLDDEPRDVAVLINGYNEFHEYVPGVVLIDDEPVPDFSQWERVYRVQPGERVSKTVREDELDEVAVDLATVVNGAPSSAEVVYFENLSSRDTRGAQYIPAVVPGLVGVRLGLRTLAPARVVLEATVRARATVDKLIDESADEPLEAMPEPFAPLVLEAL